MWLRLIINSTDEVVVGMGNPSLLPVPPLSFSSSSSLHPPVPCLPEILLAQVTSKSRDAQFPCKVCKRFEVSFTFIQGGRTERVES